MRRRSEVGDGRWAGTGPALVPESGYFFFATGFFSAFFGAQPFFGAHAMIDSPVMLTLHRGA